MTYKISSIELIEFFLISNISFERKVEDTAATLLQFESGTCATLTVTHAAQEAQDTLDVFGTKGSIHIPVLNQGELKLRIGNDERLEFHPLFKDLLHVSSSFIIYTVHISESPFTLYCNLKYSNY